MMMDDGLGPVVNSAWAGSMQLAWADSGADSLVPTVCDGLVLTMDNGLVPAGCSAWAGSVRSVRADNDVLSVVRAQQYSHMWHGMPELSGSAQWSTVSG